jgi:hypothetical protein
VGEEFDDRERLRRGLEEGVEVGGVEVDGCVAVGPTRALGDAERPVRGRRVKRGGGDGEDEEETRRRRHGGLGSRRARISRAGASGGYGNR